MKRNLLDAASVPVVHEQPLVIPSIDRLSEVDLPVLTSIRRIEPIRPEVLTESADLDNLTDLAIEAVEEILRLKLEPDSENFASVLRQKGATAAAVLTTQVRVDEGRFKKKQVDTLGKLIDLIKSEEAKQVIPTRLN